MSEKEFDVNAFIKKHAKKILFLDDRSARLHSAIEKFGDQVTLVAYAKECIKLLALDQWDIVYLDHDLNYEEFETSDQKNCGMEVVRYLVKHAAALPHLREPDYAKSVPAKKVLRTKFIIHSGNPVAATEMFWALKDAGYDVEVERWEY